MKVWQMLGRVTRLAEKTTGFGRDAELVGVRVDVSASIDGHPWHGSVEVPIAWIPEGLRVGSTLRLTAELEGEIL